MSFAFNMVVGKDRNLALRGLGSDGLPAMNPFEQRQSCCCQEFKVVLMDGHQMTLRVVDKDPTNLFPDCSANSLKDY